MLARESRPRRRPKQRLQGGDYRGRSQGTKARSTRGRPLTGCREARLGGWARRGTPGRRETTRRAKATRWGRGESQQQGWERPPPPSRAQLPRPAALADVASGPTRHTVVRRTYVTCVPSPPAGTARRQHVYCLATGQSTYSPGLFP